MEQSTEIKQLAKALSKFQAEVENVPKTATNPFFKSKYATLENLINTIKGPLEENSLSFAQFVDGDGLTTVIMHDSGEWLRATAHLVIKDHTPQGQGSAITYMRRYALSAALGVATEDDDDGNEASKPSQTRQEPARATKAAKTTPAKESRTERIKELLIALDAPAATLAEAKASVHALTNLTLDPKNYDAIISTLDKKREETDPLGTFMDENSK